MKAFAIMQSNQQTFQSKYFSGYLGLGPYSSDSEIREENIIYHLKLNGIIEHPVFSFFFQKNGQSSIKFGGYDREALYNSTEFYSFKTNDKNSWKLKSSDHLYGTTETQSDTTSQPDFLIEPQLSLIYMPSDDYEKYRTAAAADLNGIADCSRTDMPCLFSTSCDQVPDNKL